MQIELLVQPFARYRRLYDWVVGSLGAPDKTEFTAVTAWTNYRGLIRLVPALRAFRARGGAARLLVGIDEGGATRQGLELAAVEFDDAAIFHSNDTRTFHPKLYIANGATEAEVFVGSNNLTPGGLFHNYEAATVLKFDLSNRADAASFSQFARAYDDLRGDANATRRMGPILQALVGDARYRVQDETERRRGAAVLSSPDADSEEPLVAPLFGRTTSRLHPAVQPGPPLRPGPARRPRTTAALPTPPGAAARAVTKRWFRELDATAAQHPPTATSNPTGNLRLSQAGHPIDQTTYFRNDFFRGVGWAATTTPRGVREEASVPMTVAVDGRVLGTFEFQISHATWRVAGQRNVPTVLHWGPLSALLRATDYVGRFVSLEKLGPRRYNLTVDVAPTGPSLP